MKRKLFILLCAVLCSGLSGVRASVSEYLTGWTKMTSTVITNPENYYFVILHPSDTLMLGVAKTCITEDTKSDQSDTYDFITYQVSAEPCQNLNKVWAIESCTAADYTSAYVLRNLVNMDNPANAPADANYGPYELKTNGTVHENSESSAAFNLVATGTSWNIQNATATTYYWGAWTNNGYMNGRRVAGNSGGNVEKTTKGSYNIYYMSRTDFNQKYQFYGGTDMNHAITNRSFEYGSTTGWTSVRSTNTVKSNSDTKADNCNVDAQDGSKYLHMWNVWTSEGHAQLSQTVSFLPNGKYSSTVYLCNDMSYVFNGTDADSWGTTKTPINAWTAITVSNQEVTGNSTTMTVENEWNGAVDNVSLTYIPSAESYTIGNTTTAYQWYTFTIPSDGYYRIKTSAATILRYATTSTDFTSAASTASLAAGGTTSSYFAASTTMYVATSAATALTLTKVGGTPVNLTNADFEGAYAEYSSPSSDRRIYQPNGWTVAYTSGNDYDMSILKYGDIAWTNFSGVAANTDGGEQTYMVRFRWGQGQSLTLSQTVNLSAGFYQLAADGYKNANGTSALSVTAADGTEFSTSISTTGWNRYYVGFYVSSTQDVTIKYTVTQSTKDVETIGGIDNVQLFSYGTTDATFLIMGADCTSNDYWPGSGRETVDMADWTGTTRTVLTQNYNGYARYQQVNFPVAGYYRLDVYGKVAAETGEFGVQVGTSSDGSGAVAQSMQNYSRSLNHYILDTDGTESSTLKTSTDGWTVQEVYFNIPSANTSRYILPRATQSVGNNHTQYAYLGGMKMTYLGAEGDTCNMQVSATAKWGTFCAPYDVTVPARVTAYTAVKGSGSWLELTEVSNNTIPAGVPVLLNAEDGVSATVRKTYFGSSSTDASDSYVLKGVYTSTSVSSGDNNYLLQYQDGECAFYLVDSDGKTIGKNRCYLHLNEALSDARVALFPNGETSIKSVETIENEAKTKKDGKYFVDGRIIIVKDGRAYGADGRILK